MKKVYLMALILLGMAQTSVAQWTTSGTNIYNSNTGNVGIGTTTPNAKLDVNGIINTTGITISGAATSGQYLRGNGTNFIPSALLATDIPTLNQNTTGSAYYLVSRDTRAVNDAPGDFNAFVKFDFKQNSTNGLSDGGIYNGVMTWRKYGLATDFTGGPALQLAYSDNGNLWTRLSANATSWGTWTQVLNTNSGVKLQTTTPGTAQTGNLNISGTGAFGTVTIGNTLGQQGSYLLAVAGSAIATSVTVKTVNNWPDYVFKKSYHLPSLREVKTYIDKTHHLQEMPSAEDMLKDGLNLGESNKVLTKKVEELTLYLIQQNKQLAEQKQMIKLLQKQMSLLSRDRKKSANTQAN
jgi:hypothetical protein